MARPHGRLSTTARRRQTLTTLLVLTAIVMSTVLSALTPGSAAAQVGSPDTFAACSSPPTANEIVCENSKAGSPSSEWDLGTVDSSQIEGFATDISADQGGGVDFKVRTVPTDYRLDIYRIGY
jgi:hypothetical protein